VSSGSAVDVGLCETISLMMFRQDPFVTLRHYNGRPILKAISFRYLRARDDHWQRLADQLAFHDVAVIGGTSGDHARIIGIWTNWQPISCFGWKILRPLDVWNELNLS
jgi:hypothetical protein